MIFAMNILAARGRTIERLIDGDPVVWSILGVVVVGMVGWAIIKKKRSGPGGPSDPGAGPGPGPGQPG